MVYPSFLKESSHSSSIHERLYKEYESKKKEREHMYNPEKKLIKEIEENCTFQPNRGRSKNEDEGKENRS
jgi:hypothetical protein